MHTVAETTAFSRRADALLTRDERDDMILTLATNPLAGAVIAGLGGVRKLRWAPAGRGKSGAYRLIYYVLADDMPIVAIFIYGKNERSDLSPPMRREVSRMVETVKRLRR